jgi:hypothetical protein
VRAAMSIQLMTVCMDHFWVQQIKAAFHLIEFVKPKIL